MPVPSPGKRGGLQGHIVILDFSSLLQCVLNPMAVPGQAWLHQAKQKQKMGDMKKLDLPQEGTGFTGESLPGVVSGTASAVNEGTPGCPSYSGEGDISPTVWRVEGAQRPGGGAAGGGALGEHLAGLGKICTVPNPKGKALGALASSAPARGGCATSALKASQPAVAQKVARGHSRATTAGRGTYRGRGTMGPLRSSGTTGPKLTTVGSTGGSGGSTGVSTRGGAPHRGFGREPFAGEEPQATRTDNRGTDEAQVGASGAGGEERRKRTGSERRKRRKLLKQNATQEGTVSGPSKREREVSNEAGEDSEPSKKRCQADTPDKGGPLPPSSYRAALTNIKLAIVPDKYPYQRLELEDLEHVRGLITEKLEDAPDPLPILEVGHALSAGAIHVSCRDSMAAKWLQANLSGECVGTGVIRVINAADLPKPVKMAWKSRNMALVDVDRAVKMLQRLNPSLRTNEWKVVSSVVEEHHIRRVVLMDRVSADAIADAGYALPGGIEYCVFKLLEDPDRRANTQRASGATGEGAPAGGESRPDASMAPESDPPSSPCTVRTDDVLDDLDALGLNSPAVMEVVPELGEEQEGPIS